MTTCNCFKVSYNAQHTHLTLIFWYVLEVLLPFTYLLISLTDVLHSFCKTVTVTTHWTFSISRLYFNIYFPYVSASIKYQVMFISKPICASYTYDYGTYDYSTQLNIT